MTRFAYVAGLILCAASPVPLAAQEAAGDPMASAAVAAEEQVSASREASTTEAVPACKPKKKKGFGFGSILKAASKTGLTNMVGGGLLGQGGAIAGAAINTGVSVAGASAANSAPTASAC